MKTGAEPPVEEEIDMVCEAHSAAAAATDRSATPYGVPRKRATMSSPRLEARAELAPVAMTGSLAGSVVGPCGLLTQVRLLVRDPEHAVVRECYPTSFRTGYARVQFEVRGLPVDTYSLEIMAPGFYCELLHSVPVKASCVTHVGVVRLMRVKKKPGELAGRFAPPCGVRGGA
jgi:hypothetical protein